MNTGFIYFVCRSCPLRMFSPLTWTSNLKRKRKEEKKRKKSLALSPPALHSVARATVAILPCPVGLGYTSQAGHKCGMTVERGRDGQGGEKEAEGWMPTHRLSWLNKSQEGVSILSNRISASDSSFSNLHIFSSLSLSMTLNWISLGCGRFEDIILGFWKHHSTFFTIFYNRSKKYRNIEKRH